MKKSILLLAATIVGFSAIAFAQTNQVQVSSNNFLDKYIYKTNPYTYHAITTGSTNNSNGANTVFSCVLAGTTYNKLGDYGPEVVKLQNFLNDVNGARLNGQGYFGPVTQQEVKNFQYTYGIKPTGYQHVKTTQMINDIICGKVAKKARLVYVAPKMSMTANTYVKNNPVTVSAMPANTDGKNLVKDYAPKTIPTLTGDTSIKSTTSMATKTGFWANLQNDFTKIQANYKAYLLVFALVLALFWFLRKAATE